MEIKQITSTQNSYIKHLVQLRDKSRERKKTGHFIIEGQRELGLALKGGYSLDKVLYFPELISLETLTTFVPVMVEIIEISKEVYQKLAYRDSTEGLIAVANSKSHDLENLKLSSENPLILVAEAPEKPGNIGAILRTADAAAVDAVIIANPKTDLYNANIVRSSVGCLFTNHIATGSTESIISFLNKKNIAIYCAALQASQPYHLQDFSKPSAIVVGTEATGLSEAWLQASKQNIIIPMQGEIDSMNVSVAAGILIFEARRQRGFE
ncbi:TrmH family RNA methyltransferase [Gaetbulibacter aestuarii]|uniref:TrmH family RNA methyltransferase n=1 Tax=Gaetbulibacter aestuarii TaxID=1502358 RepID=A0ABW7MXI9_9FLAO